MVFIGVFLKLSTCRTGPNLFFYLFQVTAEALILFLAAMTVTTGTRRPLLVIGTGLAVDKKDQQKQRKYEYRGRQYKNYISHRIPPANLFLASFSTPVPSKQVISTV